jgi:Zn-dependent M28 family amino/carboxypeptidase
VKSINPAFTLPRCFNLKTIITGVCGVVLLTSCKGSESDKGGKFDGAGAMAYAKAQLDFGPRIPGTVGAQKAGDWIVEQMKARADTVIVQTWTHTTQDGKQLPMRNILARFNPAATDRILYITHWDTRPLSDGSDNLGDRQLPVPGANDGASGVALFVALGDALKKVPPPQGVDLLFVDGEDYGQFDAKLADVLIGSTYFASHPPEPGYKPIFGVLWDMIGDKDLAIKKEGYSVAQAPEVVDRVWSKAAELGFGKYFLDEDQGPVTDDHVPFLKAGMRVIDVIDLDYPDHHRPTDTIDKISAKSLSIIGEVAEALLR